MKKKWLLLHAFPQPASGTLRFFFDEEKSIDDKFRRRLLSVCTVVHGGEIFFI